jgi:hypothetical protein
MIFCQLTNKDIYVETNYKLFYNLIKYNFILIS